MRSLLVDIRISRDEYLKVYQSYVRQVRAVARSGESVRFPISVLQPYLTHMGVQGSFRLSFDDQYKFVGIELLS